MFTQLDLLKRKFSNIKLANKYTIQQLYGTVASDIYADIFKMKAPEIKGLFKVKRGVYEYYNQKVYEDVVSLEMSDEKYQIVLILLSRLGYLQGKLKYTNVNLHKEDMVTVAVEIVILEAILQSIYKDGHTDEDLYKINHSDAYKYYTDKEFRRRQKMIKSDDIMDSLIGQNHLQMADKITEMLESNEDATQNQEVVKE